MPSRASAFYCGPSLQELGQDPSLRSRDDVISARGRADFEFSDDRLMGAMIKKSCVEFESVASFGLGLGLGLGLLN